VEIPGARRTERGVGIMFRELQAWASKKLENVGYITPYRCLSPVPLIMGSWGYMAYTLQPGQAGLL